MKSGSTISPSITHWSGSSASTAATSSGKYLVIGRSFRDPISTSAPSRNTIDRNPSHLGSKTYSPDGMAGTALASIGATGGITGRSMLAVSHSRWHAIVSAVRHCVSPGGRPPRTPRCEALRASRG